MPDQKADRLLQLARTDFSDLSEAEEKMLRASAKGEVALCGGTAEDKGDNIPDAASWGKERTIRAAILRWLSTEREARDLVDPKGVRLAGAKVEGQLDLGDLDVPFPLLFTFCILDAGLNLRDARAAGLCLNRCRTGPILAERMRVGGGLHLTRGLTNGEVRLLGAKITGDLDCSGGKFLGAEVETESEKKGRVALNADRAEIGGNVFLNEKFHALGQVRLLGAKITGQLACSGGTFENAGGDALSADGAKIESSVFLDRAFCATGVVCLTGAKITGDLACRGGEFLGAEVETESEKKDRVALVADRAEIGGDVFLKEGFHATGEVRFLGAKITGNLSCIAGKFENARGRALVADRAEICGSVFLAQGFRATGVVRLPGARIAGNLACRGGEFVGSEVETQAGKKTKTAILADGAQIGGILFLDPDFHASGVLRFPHAKAGVLADHPPDCPQVETLILNGFTYEAIHGPTDSETRIAWLRKQYGPGTDKTFRPNPYNQLATVLRRMGHEADAKKVCIAREQDRRKYGSMGRRAKAWSLFLGATLGHGYAVWHVGVIALFTVAFGWGVFWWGHRAGLLSPTFPPPAKAAAPSEKRLDEAFCPLLYSLDVFLPVVNLHQEDAWLPNTGGGDVATLFWPDRYLGITWGHLLCFWFCFEISVGWLLVTLALVGLTSLVRRDEG